jgi:Flp pilus assembly protein protease CpaA
MNEYFFLYALGFVAVFLSAIQDIKTREIANWITFSLIAFVLAYRAFYSLYSNNFLFFIHGFFGVLLFVLIGYALYYSRVFAGGDAKLLFGIGGIFPYNSLFDYAYYGIGFVIFLFASGVLYTLIYSLFLVRINYSSFKTSFSHQFVKNKKYFMLSFLIALFVYFTLDGNLIYAPLFVFLSPLLFIYVHTVEKSCMVKYVNPNRLTEGDWLAKDVVVGKKTIKKNFEGLSSKEILLLRKYGKNVLIKSGIPFAPAFVISLLLFFYFLRYSSM